MLIFLETINFPLTSCTPVVSGPAPPEDSPAVDQPQLRLPGAAERLAGGGGSQDREELEAGGS